MKLRYLYLTFDHKTGPFNGPRSKGGELKFLVALEK